MPTWGLDDVKLATASRDEGARLLRPEKLRGLSNDDVVLLIQDSNPVLAQKVRYFEDNGAFRAQFPSTLRWVCNGKPRHQSLQIFEGTIQQSFLRGRRG